MSDEEDEAGVDLGPAVPVEGAPLARVTARLTWPITRSSLVRKEGSTVIRTPEGPRELASVLESVDETYFESPHSFERHVRAVVGTGPIPAADE